MTNKKSQSSDVSIGDNGTVSKETFTDNSEDASKSVNAVDERGGKTSSWLNSENTATLFQCTAKKLLMPTGTGECR